MQDLNFKDRQAELQNAIIILRGVLSYHERMCIVADVDATIDPLRPLDLKDTYRSALKTALEVLELECSKCEALD